MVKIIIQKENGNRTPMVKEIDSLDAVFVTGIQKDRANGNINCITEIRGDDINAYVTLKALARSSVQMMSSISKATGIPRHDVFQEYMNFMIYEAGDIFGKAEMANATISMMDRVAQPLKELMRNIAGVQETEKGARDGRSDN